MAWLLSMCTSVIILFNISICLTQDYALPRITEPNEGGATYYLNDGDNVTLPCVAEGNPQTTYKWLHNRKQLSPSKSVSVAGGYLRIQNLTSIYEGEFICVASNFFKEDGNTITVATMSSPVQIFLSHLNISGESRVEIIPVELNSYLKLTCPLGKMKPEYRYTVVWYDKNKNKLAQEKNDRHYIDSTGTLHFTYITGLDTWRGNNTFYCSVTDQIHKTYDSKIQFALNLTKTQDGISIPPRIQYTVSNLTALVKSSVKLECVFSGRDPLFPNIPKVTWYKSDKSTVINNSTKYQLKQDNRSLTIQELNESDEGYYYCRSRIGLSNSSNSATDFVPIFLNITSPPTFNVGGSPMNQNVDEHQQAVFNCQARGASGDREPNRPIWYINGETLESLKVKSKFELSLDGTKLTIHSVKRSDTMCVQCLVTNSVGITLGNGCLTVVPGSNAVSHDSFLDAHWIIVTLFLSQSIIV